MGQISLDEEQRQGTESLHASQGQSRRGPFQRNHLVTKHRTPGTAPCPALQGETRCSLPLRCCLAHLFERLGLSRQKEGRSLSPGLRPSEAERQKDFGSERRVGVQAGVVLQLQLQSCSNSVTWNSLDGAQPVPSSSWAAQNEASLPTVHVQCRLHTGLLRGPAIETSAVFLIRTHGHAGHGHGAHVHLSQVASAAIHVHHPVRCRARLVRELLLGKGAAPGQAS